MRPLSYTQISRYLQCPLSYKLQYIDKLKPKERYYFSFGDVIHQCAEYFFKVPVPPPPTLEKLLQFYESNWISDGYESPMQEQQYKSYGRQLLRDFWKINSANFRLPLAVEYQFFVKIEGIPLSGKIDRVDRLPDGVSVIDYKTNQQPFSEEHLEQDLQLTFYQMAVENTWKLPVKRLILYHLRSNIPFSCDGRPPEKLDAAKKIVLRVADGIAKKEFPATENQFCGNCDFPEHCPYQKHKFVGAGTAGPEAACISSGLDAREAVERYAALQNQKKELELQMEELRHMICQYCDTYGYQRLFGSDHALSYRIVNRNGFSEEEVKPLLEPAGLWTKVLKFDPSLVKALLEEDTIPPELRQKLEELKHITSAFPMLSIKSLTREETEL
jgi:putative RecB family exonuclease